MWSIAGGKEEGGAEHRPGQPPNDLDQGVGRGILSNKNAKHVKLEMICFINPDYTRHSTITHLSWIV